MNAYGALANVPGTYDPRELDEDFIATSCVRNTVIRDLRERMRLDTLKLEREMLLAGLLPTEGWRIGQEITYNGNALGYIVRVLPPAPRLSLSVSK